MADTTPQAHRSLYDPDPEQVAVREAEEVESDDGMMEVRMPIASTGEVRNEGDDPLTTRELRGMANQVDTLTRGVFPEHGMSNAIDRGEYSQFEKLGYWSDADLQAGGADDGEDLLVATARMPDPETLPAATGDYREALAILKEQAKRNIPIAASIGWRDDREYPGGVDLMEASLVGIGADPRTQTQSGVDAGMVARAAVDAGADPDELVATIREAATPDDGRPLGPPGDRDRFETYEECVTTLSEDSDTSLEDAEAICGAWENASKQSARATYEVGDTTVDISPPDPMVNAAREALDAKERYDDLAECGTGVGEDRARQIIEDEVGPDVVDEVAAYLTSHEEDVAGYDAPPTDWSEAEWLGTTGEDDDPRCGPVQYALWGGVSTGTALDWAQRKANEVAEARGEDIPYPDRASDNRSDTDMTDDTDDPGDEQAGTDGEQSGDDPENERAPADIDEPDVAEFLSEVYDGVDAEDIQSVMADAGATFAGVDPETVGWFVADILDVTAGEVMDMLDADAEDGDGEEEQAGGDGMDDDEEDEEDDRQADADGESETDDGERSGDVSDIREDIQSLREEYEETRDALRSGGLTVNGDREEAAKRATEDLPDDASQEEIAQAVADELTSRDGDADADSTDDDTDDSAGIDLRDTNI